MKIKDIKSQLKKETGENTPEVLDSVKKSPINKLKKDEKSMVAFKKTMATLILAFLLVIVVVLSVAIHGYTTQRSNSIDHFSFLSIRIYDGTDENGLESDGLKIYNFVLDDNGKVIIAYNESSMETIAPPNQFDDILDVLDYDGEATIYIIGASDSPAFARQYAGAIEDCMLRNDDFDGANIIPHVNESLSKNLVAVSVSLLPGYNSEDAKDANINKLCSLYVTLLD